MNIEYKEFCSKRDLYNYIIEQFTRLSAECEDLTAILANTSALLMMELSRVNWAGFYLMKRGGLVLGPFQGKPAVDCIPLGKGVCGTAALSLKPQVVEDVRRCENHIACDISSASEIVIPIFSNGNLFGVIDMDSPFPARFDAEDLAGLSILAERIGQIAAARTHEDSL